jgi:hypothetical protein
MHVLLSIYMHCVNIYQMILLFTLIYSQFIHHVHKKPTAIYNA